MTDRIATAVLPGGEILLRPVEAADLPLLRAWDADPVIEALMGRRFAEQSPEEWFQGLRHQRNARAWIIETGQRPVGEVELAQINWRNGTAEIRICLGVKECWGQGLGTAAMIHSLALAFEQMHLKAVYLRVFATNQRAIRLYERLGFRKQGILPASVRRHDPAPVLLMNLPRHRWGAQQPVAVG
ncbi:MAG: GNAT family N-acetyltransferase [Bacillota bacterium]